MILQIINFLKLFFGTLPDDKVKLKEIINTILSNVKVKKHLAGKIKINYEKVNLVDLPELIKSLCENVKVFMTDDELYIINTLSHTVIIVDLIDLKIKKIYNGNKIIIPGKYFKIEVDIPKNAKLMYLDNTFHYNIMYVSYILKSDNDTKLCIITDYMKRPKCIKIIDDYDEIIQNIIMPLGNTVYFVVAFVKNNKMFYSYYTFDGQRVLVKEIDEFGNVKFSGKYTPNPTE